MTEPIQKKVVLLGNTAVGKTSIFNRVISDTYIEEGLSTNQACYRNKIIKVQGYDRPLKLNLWDTAGQEKFMSLTNMYVKEALGVILVYDTTYADSLEGLRTWYDQVQEHVNVNQVVIAVLGNKCDMLDECQVTTAEAKRFAKEIEAQIFLEVSAKENLGIKELLENLAAELMQRDDSRDRSGSTALTASQKKKKDGCC